MIKRIQFFTTRILPAAALMALLFCQPSRSLAQDDDAPPFGGTPPPPSFVPPPPPNFTPPTAPPSMPPSRSVINRSGARTNNQASSQPTEEELLQRPSDLVDDEDPFMQETVGLIRIPEMGTNEVIEMLENFTRKPILRQQSLPSVKITFFSQGALTRAEAITAIESLLALNGISITSMGEKFLKAVPSAVITQQVARLWEGSTLDATPTQTPYQKIFELDFLTTEEAVGLLAPLMSQGVPIAFDKSNLLLITDSLINLQRIERLLPVLDQPAKLKTEMLFFQLDNISSEQVARRVESLMQGPLRRQLQNNTSVESDERTNQLVIFTHPANSALLENLIKRLDVDVAPTTATRVYSIRYADATELVNIIEQIVTGQRQVRQDTTAGGSDAATAARQRAQQAAAQRQANQQVATARAEANNLQFSDFLTIVPDERANTIVASGTHSDLSYLDQLINEIDTLLAQVRIEVVIAEVSLREGQTRGIDTFNFEYEGTGFNVDLEDSESTWGAGTNTGNSNFGVSWEDGRFGMNVVLNAAKTNSNVRVLSAPTIVTTHNKEASVSVGQEIPVVTQTTTQDLAGGTSGTTGIDRRSIQYRDVKLELKVTPLIGSDGVVQLEIEQTNQTVVDRAADADNQPIIGTRTANSYVSVMDGGLIALGGLQDLNVTRTENKMFLFGSLPIIGDFFTKNTDTTERRELLIFIRPTIIRDTTAANRDANELIDVLEGSPEIRGYLNKGTFRPDPEPVEERKEIPRRNKP